MIIEIKTNQRYKKNDIEQPVRLMDLLTSLGFAIHADCGGKGKCGKCTVKITPLDNGMPMTAESFSVLSCEYIPDRDILVEFNEENGSGLLDHSENKHIRADAGKNGYGAVIDLGTTTLALYLIDMKTGETLSAKSELNPQRRYGADVISRIDACMRGKKNELHKAISEKTAELLKSVYSEYGTESANCLYVTGNTTMLHLFLGEDPSGIGVFPFTPVFLESRRVSGESLGIPVGEIVTMPCIGSYIGGDAVCAAAASELDKGNYLMIDIGTNGELVLYSDGKYYSTSTAAGPALEGANITCGCGGISGAINRVLCKNGQISYATVNSAEAVGICGSGLIDAIAVMLECGIIDETGAFCDEDEDEFYISDKVFISAKDVREFQLAKSAVASGINVLIKRAGLTYDDIENVYIAGGLGFYIDCGSAAKTGLIPKELISKVKIIGNGAALGTKMALLTNGVFDKMIAIAESAKAIDLANDADFADEFIENMF